MTDLAAVRRRYAARMMELAGLDDRRVEIGFARVPRESFAGRPPWALFGERDVPGGPSDPASLYADVLVVLDAARGLNSGAPSLHALMLHRLGAQPGDHVVHLGIGRGYYTAILAEIVGPEGRVTAVEYDPRLADAARQALAPWPNVTVVRGDAVEFPHEPAQRIYVNFAVTLPAPRWLDALSPGGTIVLPLAPPEPGGSARALRRPAGRGAVLRIARTPGGYAVRFVSPCSFVCADGPLAGEPAQQAQLRAAFIRGGVEFVQSLCRPDPPPNRAWFWTPSWSLSYDPVPPG